MDNVYAFGVDIVQLIQKSFLQYEDYFMAVNSMADPNHSIMYLFPFIAIFDTVFASEFLIVAAVGGWINIIFKWVLAEHRPFWWVKETRYYGPVRADKPLLRLGPQTCETGPGCPSGHVTNVTIICVLFSWWLMFALSKSKYGDRTKCLNVIKYVSWLLGLVAVVSTMLSRMFIATHFPHQCLLGAIFGLLSACSVRKYFFGPTINCAERKPADVAEEAIKMKILANVSIVFGMVILSFAVYWIQKLIGVDPSWSVKLAFKWCPAPEFLHYNTTPFFSLVQTAGCALGWAMCTTPSLKSYRYDGEKRSYLIAAVSTLLVQSYMDWCLGLVPTDEAVYFYTLNFIVYALRPLLFLRAVPMISTASQIVQRQVIEDPKTD